MQASKEEYNFERMKRIFIAVDIVNNSELAGLLASFKQALREERIRWVDPGNMHLTLAFLGDNDEGQVKMAGDIMSATATRFEPFEIVFKGTGVFRNMKQARVIWLGLKVPDSFYRMQEMLCDKLEREGLYRKEKKFKPHITLGRMRYINSKESLSEILKEHESVKLPPRQVSELILFESILKPGGPEYRPLRRVPLEA